MPPLRAELDAAMARVCDSGRFILGPDCEELERDIAAYCQAPFGIACASGSDALLLALMAAEIGPGDEVLLPSYTFFATAGAVWRQGAKPVMVDIDPVTYNIDPQDAARKVTSATKAIIPVHLFGQCAEMDALNALAKQHKLLVVEDAARPSAPSTPAAAQARWATWAASASIRRKTWRHRRRRHADRPNARPWPTSCGCCVGMACSPAITTRWSASTVGSTPCKQPCWRSSCRTSTAGPPCGKTNADRYTQLFCDRGLDQILTLPRAVARRKHVWNQYIVRVPDGKRDALRESLQQSGVGTEIYYPVPLHLQACFRSLEYGPGSLPHSELAARETLALPIFPELNAAEQQTVVERIAASSECRPTRAAVRTCWACRWVAVQRSPATRSTRAARRRASARVRLATVAAARPPPIRGRWGSRCGAVRRGA